MNRLRANDFGRRPGPFGMRRDDNMTSIWRDHVATITGNHHVICQRLQEIAATLESIAVDLGQSPDRLADSVATFFATLVGAALALLGSWLIFRSQRKGDRSDRLDAMVATIVGSLGELERAFGNKFSPLEAQVEGALPGSTKTGNARSQVLGNMRIARIHANSKEREVLDAAFVHVSARDWPTGKEAQNAERVANILVAWREGTLKDDAAIVELQGRYQVGSPPAEDLARA